MTNIDSVKAYRSALDRAEGVRLANGLRETLTLHGAELPGDVVNEVASMLEEIRLSAGEDPRPHERQAKRLRDECMMKNDGLVWRIAKRTLGARGANPANLEEAVQEGRIGLMRAIDVFDDTRGSSFSTCAAYWIRHHVQNCMHVQVDFAKQRSACMPRDVVRQVAKYRATHGREPEHHELTHKGRPVTSDEWTKWTDAAFTMSLEDFANDGDDSERRAWGDSEIAADPATSPDALLASANLSEKLEGVMSGMSPRNRDITRALFIDGEQLIDVAAKFGVVPSRVHQIKTDLEKRLRKVLSVAA